jgi:cytochrome c
MNSLFKRSGTSGRSFATISLLALFTTGPWQTAHAQSPDGERLFRQRCASCHSIDAGSRGSGPSLAGLFGREAGSLNGTRYSQAMQKAGLVWDERSLDSFLEDPRGIVPGTTMTVRITDRAQRAAIISFLQDAGGGE